MERTFCITVVLFFFMDGVIPADLLPPINVRISSINMELVLQWDPALNTTDHRTTYTAEYRSIYSPYQAVCWNITAQHCDFSSFLRPFGVYSFRVMAERQGDRSSWVDILDFIMDQHTDIGPPSVILNVSGINVEVTIKDPVFRIKPFRDVYPRASYNISYWEKDQRDKAVHKRNIEQHRLILPDLEPWTSYCVQAQVKTSRFNKLSTPSEVVCTATEKAGDQVWVVAVVIIAVVAVLVGLVVCGVLYGKKMVRFIWPKVKVPKHFKECLWKPHGSFMFLAVQTSPPPEEIIHFVSVMTEDAQLDHSLTHTDHSLTHTDHSLTHTDHSLTHTDHSLTHTDHSLTHTDHSLTHTDHSLTHTDHSLTHTDHSLTHTDHSLTHTDHSLTHTDHREDTPGREEEDRGCNERVKEERIAKEKGL